MGHPHDNLQGHDPAAEEVIALASAVEEVAPVEETVKDDTKSKK